MSESCGCAGEDPNPSTVPGGWSGEKPADANVQKIANQVKADYEKKTGNSVDVFKAERYTSQIVSGTNYNVLVKTRSDKYSILKIYESLPHENRGPELVEFKENVGKCDKII
ncbi:cystatin-B-like isoform 2-T2 [Gastrophryne carolinensis]